MNSNFFFGKLIFFITISSLAVGAKADELGVSKAEILVGASQMLTGQGAPTQAAIEAKYGVEAYFRKVNEEGGINGRKLKYVVRDNGYVMPQAMETTRKLVEEDKVFALLSPVGTPTTVVTRSYVVKVGIPLVGPIDGATGSRIPVNPSIFFVRASFEPETRNTLALIKELYKTDEFAIYRPSTALGESMRLEYLKAAHEEAMKLTTIAEEGTTPGDVAQAVKTIQDAHPKVVILTGTAVSNGRFLKAALDRGISTNWLVASPSMDPAFYEGVARQASSVIIAAGFPMNDLSYPIVRDFTVQMKKENHTTEGYALEGYLNAAIFCEGVKRAGKDLNRQKFIDAMNSIHNFSLGGLEISYNSDDHAGFKKVYFFKVTKDGLVPVQLASNPAKPVL